MNTFYCLHLASIQSVHAKPKHKKQKKSKQYAVQTYGNISVMVTNITDGTITRSQNIDQVRALASMTKLMTAMIALDYDRDQDSEKSILLQIPNTAFRRSGSAKDGGQQWGLLSELNRKNRKADSGSADSYYWGDITDPKALIPCSLKLTPNPAGGIAIYNMVPIDDEDPVKISRTTLESRYDLDNVLYEITESEMIDRMVYYFSDVPKLLKRAYASRVPNIDRLITSAKAVRVTVEDQDEDNDTIEESFVASSKKNNKVESKSSSKSIEDEEEIGNENTRSFAPEEDDLPAPSKKSKNIVVDEDEDEDIDMSEDKEISVPTRKVSKTSSASESKKVSIRDLMD